MVVKKVAIIVCWIGKIPDYFDFWEFSCSKNPKYDFLVFTNNHRNNKYDNVKYIDFSLKKFNELASEKLKIKINIDKPYKLCDFRPAYGVIFEDYLESYDFWGHCDIDQIFGNLEKFITDDVLEKYSKINKNGHLTLYRNTKKVNTLFKENGSLFNYKEVFQSNQNFAFDEYTGINMIAEKQNVKCFYINNFADIDKRFRRYICKNHRNYKYQFYEYNNGKIIKIYYDGSLKYEEMMYLHFQKKKLNIKFNTFEECIAIGYKECSNINGAITKEIIEKINGHDNRILCFFEKIGYYTHKIKEFFFSTREKKKIWLKQKKSMEEYK